MIEDPHADQRMIQEPPLEDQLRIPTDDPEENGKGVKYFMRKHQEKTRIELEEILENYEGDDSEIEAIRKLLGSGDY